MNDEYILKKACELVRINGKCENENDSCSGCIIYDTIRRIKVEELPTTVVVNINDLDYDPECDELSDCISSYLVDKFKFDFDGFDILYTDTITGDITVTNIEWED